MPSIPRPGQAAPGGGTRASRPSASSSARDREAVMGSSSTLPPASRSRTGSKPTKDESLEVKIARLYKMLGTAIRPFGRFYPVLNPIGVNLKEFGDEAAEAWLELAHEDKKVMDMLLTITKASTWGNVIGVHFAIFMASIPGGEMMAGVMREADLTSMAQTDPIAAARAAGMSEEDIAAAQGLAAAMAGATNIPMRDQSNGGPGDTVRVPAPPEFQPTAGPAPSAAPPPVQSTAPQSRAAIVTPAQLGVTQPGAQAAFPQSGPPSGA